jgi:hypothetical protein
MEALNFSLRKWKEISSLRKGDHDLTSQKKIKLK